MSKKEDKKPNITYSIDENTTTGTWASRAEQFKQVMRLMVSIHRSRRRHS